MPLRLHDIAVLGATAAGLTAAGDLARRGRDVVVVDCPAGPCEPPLADWVSGDFFRGPALPPSLRRASRAVEFRRVTYHNAALDRRVDYASRARLGFFLRTEILLQSLRQAARKAGAVFRPMSARPNVTLSEDHVRLTGPRAVDARLLLLACGSPDEALASLAIHARIPSQKHMFVAGVDLPLRPGRLDPKAAPALHVVERRDRTRIGLFFAVGGMLHVRLIASPAAQAPLSRELSDLFIALQSAGLFPGKIDLARAVGATWSPPATYALDMETHVAKRCLLLGSAGGFAEGVTGHSFTPGVKSALLAAEVAHKALASRNPQDALMAFKNRWRDSLADSLRPPGTPLQMLLPLLFVNQRVVPRFTRALLCGEGI